MNVIIWARVSSREQKEGYSIDAQLRATRERAEKNGWDVVREFAVAESAKRGAERTVFNEMYKWVKSNAKEKKIEAILAHKLDRVCRNMRDAVRLQELEDACGVRLSLLDNQFSPGAAGALSFNVMAAVAQYYSDNLRSEVLKGMDEKVRQGWPTGTAPYGYVNSDDKTEPIKPHPEKSKTLMRLFDLYSTGKYTFQELADKLYNEGYIYRNSTPKFQRTALSYILKNRFYIGELVRNGQTYTGKYKVFIDRATFNRCQDVMNGRNRRTGRQDLLFSGCLLRCDICGAALTGEKIRRKLRGGGVNEHIYYKCGNNKENDHPSIRWQEDKLEDAIVQELDTIRIPSPEVEEWLRETLVAIFSNATEMQNQQRKLLKKRKTELVNMHDRLLNGYLGGMIDETTFAAKSVELKTDLGEIEKQMLESNKIDASRAELALSVLDFSQNLVKIWHGSNFAQKREILECVSSNRKAGHLNLYMTMRKPFDYLSQTAIFKGCRGDWIRTSDLRHPKPTR